MSGSQAAAALAAAWPEDAIAVLEAPSSTMAMRNRLRIGRPGSYYFGASGGLGFGISAAVGVQLAQPNRPVVAILGEGSAQYGITALWTAVAYKLPVTFLVLRNAEYMILKWFAMLEQVEGAPGLELPGSMSPPSPAGTGCRPRKCRAPTSWRRFSGRRSRRTTGRVWFRRGWRRECGWSSRPDRARPRARLGRRGDARKPQGPACRRARRGAGPRAGNRPDQVRLRRESLPADPAAVVTPRDVGDVVRLLASARATRTPLVFRAGGTSLNGQSQTDSVLVDCRRHFSRVRVREGGARVQVQPGAVLGRVNRLLVRHGRKLGPDPASTDIACVGGVIANNSGGMRCGVVADSYQTVRALTLVLANGAVIDTAAPDAEARFAATAPELAAGLIELRDELRADGALAERVRRKFEIKNTTGYRLCAFLDADTPLEIFRRLVIGSEGTLAFVADAEFETVPLGRHTTIALVFFEDLDSAADAVGPLVAAGPRRPN